MKRLLVPFLLASASLVPMAPAIAAPKAPAAAVRVAPPVVHYRTATIDGVKMFYREAGPAPVRPRLQAAMR